MDSLRATGAEEGIRTRATSCSREAMGVEMGMGIRTREAEETATTMGGIELKD